MPNTRILIYNAIDYHSISANNVAALHSIESVKSNDKSAVYRSSGTSCVITVSLPALNGAPINVVAFPLCNLSPTATVRVQAAGAPGSSDPDYDSGAVAAVIRPALNWTGYDTVPEGVNGYSYGSGVYAVVWISRTQSSGLTITISDPSNVQGYIELSRIVAGPYHEFDYNPDWGLEYGPVYSTRQRRNGAGNMSINRGPLSRSLSFSFGGMPTADRRKLLDVLFKNGLDFPVFVSVLPENTDKSDEYELTLFGFITSSSKIAYKNFNQDTSSVTIEQF